MRGKANRVGTGVETPQPSEVEVDGQLIDGEVDVAKGPAVLVGDVLDGVGGHAGARGNNLEVGLIVALVAPQALHKRVVDCKEKAIGADEDAEQGRRQLPAQESPHGHKTAKGALIHVADASDPA